MKKTVKRFQIAFLVCMLLGVLGVQIYAAGSTRAVVGSPVRWKYENYGSGMNVYGNETVSNGSRVTLWEHNDGSLISVNTTEQTVSCLDTSDGSTRTVSWQLPNIAQPTKVLPSDFISNMLIVFAVGDDGKDGAYAISIDSGATQELNLLTQYPDTALDEPLAIVAQKGDKLLVAPVIDTVSMKIDMGDGSSVSLPAAHASFAWLSTEDYLNNVERYEQISQ